MTPSEQPLRLPIVKIIAGALVLTWERRYRLLQATWLPLLLGMGVTITLVSWGPSASAQAPQPANGDTQSSALAWMLPIMLLTVIVTVRSYRVFLLEPQRARQTLPLSWGMQETRFVLAMLLVAVAFIAAVSVLGNLLSTVWTGVGEFARKPIGLLLLLLPAWLVSRLLLAFPPLATGEVNEVFAALGHSWQLTPHNSLRVFALCVVMPSVIAWALDVISSAPLPGISQLCAVAVWLVMPLESAMVALCYDTLNRHSPRSPDET